MLYESIRQFSQLLCQPLEVEDYGLQSMPDVSPPKWHLAHTTWFFETFLLQPHLKDYEVFHPQFSYLFNSYYEAVGARHPRPQRGLISRPTVREIYHYRAYVDQAMKRLIEIDGDRPEVSALITLGLHHEQQHQELLLMDIKYNFSINPLYPAYQNLQKAIAPPQKSPPLSQSLEFTSGIHEIGHNTLGFCFDNELPRHPVLLRDGALDPNLITNGEYLEFMDDGGYEKPEFWLSEGWSRLQTEQWQAPLYWIQQSDQWFVITLMGLQPVALAEPVCHVSYYEADAFARWKGKSLPTESEWEVVAQTHPIQGHFADAGYFHPQAASQAVAQDSQLYGTVWEWTQSPYVNYPGFQIAPGAVGEYNGKFMSNQMVLRGGCCVTPAGHIRSSYRNFFPPHTRWQFSGIRLCSHAS